MASSDLPEIETALMQRGIRALAIACPENERPLHGLAGRMDWRFHGLITLGLRSGIITGKPGECAYVPAVKNGTTFHLFLLGAGPSSAPGTRGALPAESLQTLKKNLAQMKMAKIGISLSDFGAKNEKELAPIQKISAIQVFA